MSSRQDSTSKQESFIYERVEGPDHSFTVRQHKVIKRLGKGGFAEVYKIVRLSDQKDLAIKVIKKEKGGTKYS
jgi:serine/threonine protein kinase